MYKMLFLSILTFNAYAGPQYDCLLQNAYNEARGEGELGVELVTSVVMNRAELNDKTACEVIYAPGQFSWVPSPLAAPREFKKKYMKLIKRVYKKRRKRYAKLYFFHAKDIEPFQSHRAQFSLAYRGHVFYDLKP